MEGEWRESGAYVEIKRGVHSDGIVAIKRATYVVEVVDLERFRVGISRQS